MQALMLAAGMGSRLGKYTEAKTKCMVEVGGKTLLDHAVEALKLAGITKFIVVVGWESEKLINYIKQNITGIDFEFIHNDDYAKTNNIYSLYLAKDQLCQDDTILLESDIIFEKDLIRRIVESPERNLVAVAKYEHWMDGTVTTLSNNGTIQSFIDKKNFSFNNAPDYYKTVNIYKFSKEFSKNQYLPFLEAYIKAYGKNQYYEAVLSTLAHLENAQLKAFVLENENWYEIDDAQDLDIANTLFADKSDRLFRYEFHYGGYWRFPRLNDFCYLVNPYFPPKKMTDRMKYFFNPLLTQYPSGMSIQKLLAGKMFSVEESYLLVGNGAAELINVLGHTLSGKMAVPIPAFNEYIRCFKNCEIIPIYTEKNDYRLDTRQLINATKNADILSIINPDNPSGSFLDYDDIIEILEACKRSDTTCIIDESFIDFADSERRYELISNKLLEEYPNLIVIKSISKSYGVPGIRLGVLACSDTKLTKKIVNNMSIWNINSFAEYFLQIYSLYKADYKTACDKIADQRNHLMTELKKIPCLKVYPSQANYIMCKITMQFTAKELATRLLDEYRLLIKDLSQKDGFNRMNYIRIAVKDESDNNSIISALKTICGSEGDQK